jgi:hypothetical protein
MESAEGDRGGGSMMMVRRCSGSERGGGGKGSFPKGRPI